MDIEGMIEHARAARTRARTLYNLSRLFVVVLAVCVAVGVFIGDWFNTALFLALLTSHILWTLPGLREEFIRHSMALVALVHMDELEKATRQEDTSCS